MTTTPGPRCRASLERLSRYVDGDLDRASQRLVEEHLGRCPCCLEMAESLRRTVRVCREAGHRRLPAPVRARAKSRIQELLASEPGPAPARTAGSRRR